MVKVEHQAGSVKSKILHAAAARLFLSQGYEKSTIREISSAGIMRSHLSVPCDVYFTMERKLRVFLETTFLIYHVPEEKIQEAIEFVMQFDWKSIANGVIQHMLEFLESKT